MIDISTEIADVRFENPVIIGASSLTNDFGKIRELVRAGAGGITTKLISDVGLAHHKNFAKVVLNKEGFHMVGDLRVRLEEGVKMVKEIKRELRVPVIPNIAGDGTDIDSWLRVANPLRDAGADMIELDMGPGKLVTPETAREVIGKMRSALGLPIVMKMGGYGAYEPAIIGKAGKEGGANAVSGPNVTHGIVAPNIDKNFKIVYPDVVKQGSLGQYSGPGTNAAGLFYALQAAQFIRLPLISGGGVLSWQNAVERISLGANAISLVSAVYLKGLPVIKECLNGITRYLSKNKLKDLDSLKGAALENYLESHESQVKSPYRASVVDLDGSWKNHLPEKWWTGFKWT